MMKARLLLPLLLAVASVGVILYSSAAAGGGAAAGFGNFNLMSQNGIGDDIRTLEASQCQRVNFIDDSGSLHGGSYILHPPRNVSGDYGKCDILVIVDHGDVNLSEKDFKTERIVIINFPQSNVVTNFLPGGNIFIPNVYEGTTDLSKPVNLLPLQEDNFEVIIGKEEIYVFEKVLRAFHQGKIPVLSAQDVEIPFHDVLDWERALVRSHPMSVKNYGLSDARVFELKRAGFDIWTRYFASREKFVDFSLAYVQHKMGLDPPFHKEIRLETFPAEAKSNHEKSSPVTKVMTAAERRYLWNVAYHPWHRTPGDFLARRSQRLSRYDDGWKERDSEQFTVVCMTYTKTYLLQDMVEQFRNITQVKAVIILWNNLDSDPAHDSNVANLLSTSGRDGLPEVIFARSQQNSLNNRMLPLELIETECIFQVDDDTRRLKKDAILSGFRVWQTDRENLVGFQSRHVHRRESGKGWAYGNDRNEVSIVLTTAAFHHKFYSYKYTYEMFPGLLSKVNDLMNCEDIFLSGLVQSVTGRAPLMAIKNNEFSCGKACEKKGQDKGLHMDKNHYKERAICVNMLEEYFGYLPLMETRLVTSYNKG